VTDIKEGVGNGNRGVDSIPLLRVLLCEYDGVVHILLAADRVLPPEHPPLRRAGRGSCGVRPEHASRVRACPERPAVRSQTPGPPHQHRRESASIDKAKAVYLRSLTRYE
jgi:hypothetical protein